MKKVYAIYWLKHPNKLLDTICHSDDRREEDELLRTLSEKSREHKVDVTEILRFALDDTF